MEFKPHRFPQQEFCYYFKLGINYFILLLTYTNFSFKVQCWNWSQSNYRKFAISFFHKNSTMKSFIQLIKIKGSHWPVFWLPVIPKNNFRDTFYTIGNIKYLRSRFQQKFTREYFSFKIAVFKKRIEWGTFKMYLARFSSRNHPCINTILRLYWPF